MIFLGHLRNGNNIKVGKIIQLGLHKYIVRKSGENGYYLYSPEVSNAEMFNELQISNPHTYLQRLGFEVSDSGVFPYVKDLKTFQKIIGLLERLHMLNSLTRKTKNQ